MYDAARRLDPTRASGMAHYSTVLWHLKRAAPLAVLAHTLSDMAPLHPETWYRNHIAFSKLCLFPSLYFLLFPAAIFFTRTYDPVLSLSVLMVIT